MAIWLVSRTAFRRLAAGELSVASGSCMPRIATAACSTRIGSVSFGIRAKASDHLGRDGPRGHRGDRELIELGRLGQLAVPEEVGDLLERGLPREVVDVVAAVGEAPVGTVEVAELGLGGDDPFESSYAIRPPSLVMRCPSEAK